MSLIHYTEQTVNLPICRKWREGEPSITAAKNITCDECRSYLDGNVYKPETVHMVGAHPYPKCGLRRPAKISLKVDEVNCMKCINERG